MDSVIIVTVLQWSGSYWCFTRFITVSVAFSCDYWWLSREINGLTDEEDGEDDTGEDDAVVAEGLEWLGALEVFHDDF